MSVWPRSSKKAGENQPQTRNSAKVGVYSRSVGSHMVSKIPIFDSPPNPHLAQRRLDYAQGELLQFRQWRVQLHAFHGCEAQVQASEWDAAAYGPPSFQRILGGSQLIPGFPRGAELGWKACSIFQPISSTVGPGVGLNGLNTVFNV